MSGVMRQALGLSLAIATFAGLGCAQDADLKERLRTIRANREAQAATGGSNRLELTLAGGAKAWCPSAWPPAQLQVIQHNPVRVRRTPVYGVHQPPEDILPFTEVAMRISAGTVSPDGMLVSPWLPLSLLNQTVTVEAHLARNPAVKSSLVLPTTFDCDQAYGFRAKPGRTGSGGSLRGENGEAGLDLIVGVLYIQGGPQQRLVMVKAVPSAGPPAYFVLAPGRKLSLAAHGGAGGPGGHSTIWGIGGGLGGDGGDGGRVEVHFDKNHPELRGVVQVANAGGEGGPAGTGPGGEAASPGRAGRPGAPATYHGDDVRAMFKTEIEGGLPVPPSARNEI